MTTSTMSAAPVTPPMAPGRAVRIAGLLTAAGTAPYLGLKAIWMAGGTVGVRDPAAMAEPVLVVMNGVTAAMDVLVIVLAIALTRSVAARLPAWLVLLPMWVGVGFLLPIAAVLLPAAATGSLTASIGDDLIEPWVRPLVYGGFAWQGIGLAVVFTAFATRRWGQLVTASVPVAEPVRPLLRVLVGGGAVTAGMSAALHVASGIAAGGAPAVTVALAMAAFAVAGAAGVVALARGATRRRWTAVLVAWAGTGAMFAWGLWSVTVSTIAPDFADPEPLGGSAALTGLLAGFALAVAGLLAVTPSRSAADRGDAGTRRHADQPLVHESAR